MQLSCVVFRFVKVGSYDGSAPLKDQLQMDRNAIVWTGGTSKVSQFVIFLGNSYFIFSF